MVDEVQFQATERVACSPRSNGRAAQTDLWLDELGHQLDSFPIDLGDLPIADALPPRYGDRRLRQMLDRVWACVRSFEGEKLQAWMAVLLALVETERPTLRRSQRDEVMTLIAIGLVWRDDTEGATSQVWALLERSTSRFRSTLLAIQRLAAWRRRDFDRFYQLPRTRLGRAHTPVALVRAVNLAMEAAAEAEQLRFKAAERLAKEALKLSSDIKGAEGQGLLLPTCVLASIAYETGAMDEAELLLRGRMALMDRKGDAESATLAYFVGARVALAQGNHNVALMVLEQGEEIGVRRRWPRLVFRCASENIRLQLEDGRLDLAQQGLARIDHWLTDNPQLRMGRPLEAWPLQLAKCRVLIAANESCAAVDAGQVLLDLALRWNHPELVIRCSILLTTALYASGRVEQSIEMLRTTLLQGADAGLFQTFLDDLPLIVGVLKRLKSESGASLGHMGGLVESLLGAKGHRALASRKKTSNHGLSEGLTERETVVLRLMSLGLSNKEIARELNIMTETIKSHAKRIFIKLAANGRTEAVSRAIELGVI